MSGVQITGHNVYQVQADLSAKLQKQLDNGTITPEQARKQMKVFVDENTKAFIDAKKIQNEQAAQAEASDSAKSAMGLDLSDKAKGAEKTEPSQTQELFLKAAHDKYPDNIVELGDDGYIVVKDKDGKIDEAKTAEARKIEVDGSPIKVTIQQDKAKPEAVVANASKAVIDGFSSLDTEKEAHEEFTTGSKEDAEKAKKQMDELKDTVKAKNKELDNLYKKDSLTDDDWKKIRGYRDDKNVFHPGLENELNGYTDDDGVFHKGLNAQLTEAENAYQKAKALSTTKGEKGIAKAMEQNENAAKRLNTLEHVFNSKEQEKAWLEQHPEDKGKTTSLSKSQRRTLGRLVGYSRAVLDEAEAAVRNAKNPEAKELAEERLKAAQLQHGFLADCMDEKGNIDAKKLQTGLAQFSGGDYRFNIDEKDEVASRFHLKSGDIKSIAKQVGFDDEGKLKGKLIAAGTAAAAAALGGLIGPHKKSASAYASDSKTATATVPDTVVPDRVVRQKVFNNGKETVVDVNVPGFKISGATGVATATAEAFAQAVSKVPILGQLAGPALAGAAAFLLTDPKSENVFTDGVDGALENLNTVKGNESKKMVAKIQDMVITGDPERDRAIKAAVLTASGGIGPSTDKREIAAAYIALKQCKEAIGQIEILPEPPKPEPPKPPEPSDPPAPPVKPDPKLRGHARDHALLQRHGVSDTENDPKAKGQFVIADEDGETKITGDMKKPDTITLTDNTNNQVNTYNYRQLTQAEIEAGKTNEGVPIKKSTFAGRPGPFYVLTSATDGNGKDVMSTSAKTKFAEVYQLELEVQTPDDPKAPEYYKYNLEQYTGMSGSNTSSVKYPRVNPNYRKK